MSRNPTAQASLLTGDSANPTAPSEPANSTASPTAAEIVPATPPKPTYNLVLPKLFQDYAQPAPDFFRGLIGGLTGSGKTRLIMTMPRPCLVIIAERSGGDVDLREVPGIIPIHVQRGEAEMGVNKVMSLLASPEGKKLDIQSIAVDSLTFLQNWMMGDVCRNSTGNASRIAGGATIRNYGLLAARMKPFLQNLFSMEAHVLLTSHVKFEEDVREEVIDGERVQIKQKIGFPDLTPAIRTMVESEVTFLGYTWRKENKPDADGNEAPDSFGVSFKARTQNRHRRELLLENAKAPGDWGSNAEPNVTAWIERIAKEKNLDMHLKAA